MTWVVWFQLVSKFENEQHRTTPPTMGMDTSSGGKKPELKKDPWVTTGYPRLSAHVHTTGPRGRSAGNANGQDKWVGTTGRFFDCRGEGRWGSQASQKQGIWPRRRCLILYTKQEKSGLAGREREGWVLIQWE